MVCHLLAVGAVKSRRANGLFFYLATELVKDKRKFQEWQALLILLRPQWYLPFCH
jgi:hypothetical protein